MAIIEQVYRFVMNLTLELMEGCPVPLGRNPL